MAKDPVKEFIAVDLMKTMRWFSTLEKTIFQKFFLKQNI